MSRYKLATGNAGEEIYEFDVGAEIADVDRAYQEAWESIQDETGAVSVARLGRMQAFQNARSRGLPNNVQAYLKQRQAKMAAKYSEMVNSLRTPIYNTETSFCFRQLGFGTPIPTMTLDAPRSTPGVIVGFAGLSRTMRSIGLTQVNYRSLPLIDTVNQNPTYGSFGGALTVNWVPLSFLQNEYDRNCGTSCFPRFLAGRIWYPTALISASFVQVANVGDDAVPLQDHSLTLLVATAFDCEPKGFRSVLTAEALDGVRALRRQFGAIL